MKNLDVKKIYRDCGALLEGHFLLSSGNHSKYYLQSAKVLENPHNAELLAQALKKQIESYGLKVDCVCSPALGGIIAGYELARALKVRFIFTERVSGEMTLRRGFAVKENEKILICEDIITTGGSALECASCVSAKGAKVVGFAGLANRGFCNRVNFENKDSKLFNKLECKLPNNLPLFALEDFILEMYPANSCPLCEFSIAYKPGSR